ncbi:MAG: NUDIX hydrolase [Rhodocyclales bacterium]|nr:NUDIX hydrolase [Rhodocyclales bacterium]
MNKSGPDPLAETELDSECVFEGGFLKVLRDRVRLPDGSVTTREYIRHPGAVVVIALDADGRLIVERQFRYPLRRAFIELPAGKIDPGEDELVCAQRELREETGYVAARWQHLGTMHTCIGYSDERIEVYLARDLTHVGDDLDEGEFLEILRMHPSDMQQAIHAGGITDAKTISALFFGLPHLS